MSKIQYIDGIPMGIDRTKVPLNLAKPEASHAMLGEVAPLTKEKLLEKTLRAVLKRWKYDADQGDGIHETDYRLYNRAMKLIDQDYEPL